jgi:outer membrane immunogenic protein
MILVKLLRMSAAALGTLAVASVTQANAADIYAGGGGYKDVPVAPCCSFTGFYIGGNMGMAWSQLDLNGAQFQDAWVNPKTLVPGHTINTFNMGGKDINSTNGFGGGQLGYNFQSSCCWLYGIEVDLGALALNNNSHRYMAVNDHFVNGVSLDGNNNDDAFFAGDITGRLGYTFGNSLVYVKGGFAFVDANNTGLNETIYWKSWYGNALGYGASSTFGNNSGDNWLTGWTVGAGYEWKPCCQSNWSIKVEYLHYDFSLNNNNNCCNDFYTQNVPGISNRFRNNNDLTADTVKIGFNYFWSPGNYTAPLK